MVSIAAMAAASNSDPPVHSSTPHTTSAAPIHAVSTSLSLPIPIMKLTMKNYLTWCQFMLVLLKSNRALRFIQYSEILPKFLSESKRLEQRINPGLSSWEEQEETVFSIKVLIDSLASIGSSISLAEHIDCILDGLNEDFKPVVRTVENQVDPPSINDLEQFLLTFESRLLKNRHKSISNALSANAAAAPSPSQSPQSVSTLIMYDLAVTFVITASVMVMMWHGATMNLMVVPIIKRIHHPLVHPSTPLWELCASNTSVYTT
ncbi:hypothetical protein Lal_00012023 [Lupinus albus]|nr:hypothetical protein Lal_00012023 [Lupinus albus]